MSKRNKQKFSGQKMKGKVNRSSSQNRGLKEFPKRKRKHWKMTEEGKGIPQETNSTQNRKRERDIKTSSDTSSLICPSDSASCKKINSQIIAWPCSESIVSTPCENEMLPIILHWDTERGMMKDQPEFRKKKVMKFCKKNNIPLLQALSLRRHHIKLRNPRKSMQVLGLGKESDIRMAADLFETCVEEYLRKCNIDFITEEDQRKAFLQQRQEGEKTPPTPDFLFKESVELNLFQKKNGKRKNRKTSRKINWIEVKMFYGASLITKYGTAVGNITYTAKKYVSLYGPGAMVFAYGFGEGLETKLESMNVTLLDAKPLDLTKVENHQKTWCADNTGMILP